MEIKLTEGELIRLIKRIINEGMFGNDFYLKNIDSAITGILGGIEKYKNRIGKMPKRFKSKYIKEDYFNEILDIIFSLRGEIRGLNGNIQSLYGVSYNLNDYLNESSNREAVIRNSNEFIEEMNKLVDFILGIKNIFAEQSLDEIKIGVKYICMQLVNYEMRVTNYYEYIRSSWRTLD